MLSQRQPNGNLVTLSPKGITHSMTFEKRHRQLDISDWTESSTARTVVRRTLVLRLRDTDEAMRRDVSGVAIAVGVICSQDMKSQLRLNASRR